jgi:amino acid adenylation domain-containing protein
MANPKCLHQFLEDAARVRPDHPAVEEAKAAKISHRELALVSDRLRDRLRHLGVRPRDRVGIYLPKSIDSVASIFGILKIGAAYVPVDPTAPAARNAYILSNCSVSAVVMDKCFAGAFDAEIGPAGGSIRKILLDGVGGGQPLRNALARDQENDPAPAVQTALSSPHDLAYILYTSGSTGQPKGVMLSHENAMSYVEWCSGTFEPNQDDRFSSHAPFHFDLSILDIYVPIKHGATLVLIGEDIGKDPVRLAPLISEERISVWYSVPSILSLLAQYGKLDQYDYSTLRVVLFAGEIFPVKHLRALKKLWPSPRYFNLYGPTETNVCTYHEIPTEIPEGQTKPFPIGMTCSQLQSKVVDEQGREVPLGREGELCIAGPGVMQGYWNLPENTARAFLENGDGRRWYRTGDIVREAPDRRFIIIGRRDRMVKKRGYRIELGEIEMALYRHPSVKEAAAVALSDEENGVRIKAFLSCRDQKRPSIIELKRFCSENLPAYMVPDLFSFEEILPKTSTDKVDYQRLKELN